MGVCPSGQRERAVNPPAQPTVVQIHSPPYFNAGVAQLVEHQPSKLNVASSTLVSRSIFCRYSSGVERFLGKEEATSSNLVIGSNNSKASHYLKVLTQRAVRNMFELLLFYFCMLFTHFMMPETKGVSLEELSKTLIKN